MNNRELLSRTESAALRGIAILGIILHNYCHFLGFAVKENEYKFDPARPMQFFDKPVHPFLLLLGPLWRTRIPFHQWLRTGKEI